MVETPEGVSIGYDSQVSTGYQKTELEARKVFVNNGIIFGVAGSMLDAQTIRYAPMPDPAETGWDVDRWVTTELVPHIKEALHEAGILERHSGKLQTNCHVLAVVNGRVYDIYSDTGWIRRTDGLYAIGSGGNYALGALCAGASVEDALHVAVANDSGTGYPLHFVESEELL